LLVAASGIVPVGASGGHWAITRWFVQFAARRSIATHTLMAEPIALDEPWLVLKGAGHYENGCRPCHGSPDLPTPVIAAAMLPPPPYLPPRVRELDPDELFYIVKHGLKFTGMPAWPAQERDDEVRAVVAFLLAMRSLDAAEYQSLVHGDAPHESTAAPLDDLMEPAQVPDVVAFSCARCHGADGRGRGSAAFPALAGQSREYLERSLVAYADAERHSGIMQPIAVGLDARDLREAAQYYAELDPGAPLERDGPRERIERGARIAERGIPERGVPACRDCHGPTAWPRNPAYPRLDGQYADYLVLQLELFQADQRGGSSYAHLMRHVAPRLSREQMRDVALYYSSLSADASPSATERATR
jgi:cytochrome c553